VLDDIFVLCRAFEQTWANDQHERQHTGQSAQAEAAVVDTVQAHGITALPDVCRFVGALRAFQTADAGQVEQWFGSDGRSGAEMRSEVLRTIRGLQEAITSGRWNQHDSRKLGRLVYRMRCAVVHPSLDTHNSLAVPVLPALRAALVELTIARSAARYGLPLAATHRQFDAAL